MQWQAMPGHTTVPRPAAATVAVLFSALYSYVHFYMQSILYCETSVVLVYFTFMSALACTHVSAALSAASQIRPGRHAEPYGTCSKGCEWRAFSNILAQSLMLLCHLKMYLHIQCIRHITLPFLTPPCI